jgi:hypothetical protein
MHVCALLEISTWDLIDFSHFHLGFKTRLKVVRLFWMYAHHIFLAVYWGDVRCKVGHFTWLVYWAGHSRFMRCHQFATITPFSTSALPTSTTLHFHAFSHLILFMVHVWSRLNIGSCHNLFINFFSNNVTSGAGYGIKNNKLKNRIQINKSFV